MNENSMALRFYIDILHANLKIINKNEKQRKGTLKKAALMAAARLGIWLNTEISWELSIK